MPPLQIGDKGPCEIIWAYGESNEINLGESLGDTNLVMEEAYSAVEVEKYGDAELDGYRHGRKMRLEVPFAWSSLQQLAVILDASIDEVNEQLIFANVGVGCSMLADSQPIVLRPLCDGAGNVDPATWIRLFHCFPNVNFTLTWNRGEAQRVYAVTFIVFMSTESGQVGQFGEQGVIIS